MYRRRCRREREQLGKPGTSLETGNAKGMRSSGKLERINAGTAEEPKPKGNLRSRTPAQHKGSAYGATRKRNPG